MDKLAELLRQGADKLVNFPTEAQRFITNPQAFTQLLTGKNPLPRETGFAAGATGLPAQQGTVLDPDYQTYMQGYEQGEPVGYAGMALPFAAPIAVATAKALAPKLGQVTENYMVKQGMIQPMFIGPESKLWDASSAFQAAKLEKQGVSPEDIWKQTGTGRGLDNQFRQEISDVGMTFDPVNVDKFRRMVEADTRHDPMKSSMNIYDLVKHSKLQESYPESAQTLIFRGQSEGGGSASPATWDAITLGVQPANRYISKAESTNDMAGTLLHELQHNVQGAEGFAKGGNAQMFKEIKPTKDQQKELDRLKSKYESLEGGSPERSAAVRDYFDLEQQFKPYGQYYNLAGETEARLTARRRLLDDAARRQNYPFKRDNQTGLDIDPNNVLVIEEYGNPVITRKEMLEQLLNKQK